jgi:hypothetical protein
MTKSESSYLLDLIQFESRVQSLSRRTAQKQLTFGRTTSQQPPVQSLARQPLIRHSPARHTTPPSHPLPFARRNAVALGAGYSTETVTVASIDLSTMYTLLTNYKKNSY